MATFGTGRSTDVNVRRPLNSQQGDNFKKNLSEMALKLVSKRFVSLQKCYTFVSALTEKKIVSLYSKTFKILSTAIYKMLFF